MHIYICTHVCEIFSKRVLGYYDIVIENKFIFHGFNIILLLPMASYGHSQSSFAIPFEWISADAYTSL